MYRFDSIEINHEYQTLGIHYNYGLTLFGKILQDGGKSPKLDTNHWFRTMFLE